MRYRVVVHAPVPEGDDGSVERLRAAAEAKGLEVGELTTHDAPGGEPASLFHLESTIEALSSYDARVVSGLNLFAEIFGEAGLPVEKDTITIAAERATSETT